MTENIETNWIEISGELLSEDVVTTLRQPDTDFEYAQPDTFTTTDSNPIHRPISRKTLPTPGRP